MGHLSPPNLPLYLYRYRSLTSRIGSLGKLESVLEREIEAITEPYLYCSEFNRLNDPMEGFYRPNTLLSHDGHYDELYQKIYDGKSKVGIASLSDTKENELMWAHYAGNYTGFCIEYYAARLLKALPENVDLTRMGYDDNPPRITKQEIVELDKVARKILSQKKYNWGYEREWRILGPVGKMNIDAAKPLIRSVYLGSRIDRLDRSSILQKLKKAKIRIYEMGVDGYKHGWKRVKL